MLKLAEEDTVRSHSDSALAFQASNLGAWRAQEGEYEEESDIEDGIHYDKPNN